MRLGHSSIQITVDRYGHLLPGIADDLAAGLDTAFAASGSERDNVETVTSDLARTAWRNA
jgi:hypothetical protein